MRVQRLVMNCGLVVSMVHVMDMVRSLVNMMLSVVVVVGGRGRVVVVTQMVPEAFEATQVGEASVD